jgi:hypothetical protein
MDEQIDISEIIGLVRQQALTREDVIMALQACSSGYWDGKAYYRLTCGSNAEVPDAAPHVSESLMLVHKKWGTVVLDILYDGRAGGIEFVSRL